MAIEIKVPDMGESVIEATIARWMKQEGERVAAGEPVVELETDKINLEVGAQQAGVLQRIAHQVGDTVAVGDVLAFVGEEDLSPGPFPEGKGREEQPAAKEPTAADKQQAAPDKRAAPVQPEAVDQPVRAQLLPATGPA